MCDPVSITLAAGTALSAYGSVRQGQAAKRAGQFNAQQAEIQALDTIERGNTEEARYRREVAQLAGAQRATFGARNVQPEGTALEILMDTARVGEQDALTIRGNARKTAAGLTGQAGEYLRQGRAGKRQGYFQAGSTLLTSGSQAYGLYKQGL